MFFQTLHITRSKINAVKSLTFVTALLSSLLPISVIAAGKLYQQHCASCHGKDRLGAMGPALLPQNLSRLQRTTAIDVIGNGRAATQMPGFKTELKANEIDSLVKYIYTKPNKHVDWTLTQIEQSHIVHYKPSDLGKTPQFKSDPMNIFIVVETGDHHATVLDGDSFKPLHRFKTRYALHGGPKYSPDGRFVYFASRDGWISKFDIYNFKTTAEIRVGINTRNLAVSHDGRYAIAANYLPHTLVILDTNDLTPIKVITAKNKKGLSSRVSAVYTAPPRKSFIAAFKDIQEVWEIPYSEEHEPIYEGLVHDYRMGEGIASQEAFPIRKILLDDYLDDFFFDQQYENLIGAARNNKNGQVVSLIVGKKIADIDLKGMPHLGSGISWQYKKKTVMATPHLKDGVVSIIDMQNWQTLKKIETLGPGFFMRSHENSPYAWVDVFFGKNHDAVHVIDKRSLKIVKTLKPVPNKTAAHVEFTRDGKYALLSIWDREGAVIVYDATKLSEVTRIPMNKPSGKYNVYNKIRYASGTSH